MCVTWRMTTPRKLLWIVSLPTVIRGGVFGSELRAAIRNCATAESTHNLSGPSSCPAPELVPTAAYPPATVANLALPTPRAVQSHKLLCSPSLPTLHDVPSATPPCQSIPGVVAPKLAISRLLPSKVGAHTQWRSLPRSIPATFRRITGKPSSCRRLFSQLSISSLPGICFLSEHARPGWPFMDSGLGESLWKPRQ